LIDFIVECCFTERVDSHDHPPSTIELVVGSETLMRSLMLLPA
jgi:hypothetical protein